MVFYKEKKTVMIIILVIVYIAMIVEICFFVHFYDGLIHNCVIHLLDTYLTFQRICSYFRNTLQLQSTLY